MLFGSGSGTMTLGADSGSSGSDAGADNSQGNYNAGNDGGSGNVAGAEAGASPGGSGSGNGEDVPAWKQPFDEMSGRLGGYDERFGNLEKGFNEMNSFIREAFSGGYGQDPRYGQQQRGQQEEPVDEMDAFMQHIGQHVGQHIDGRLSQYEQDMQIKSNISAQDQELQNNPEYNEYKKEFLGVLEGFGIGQDMLPLVTPQMMRKALRFAKLERANATPPAQDPPSTMGGGNRGGQEDLSIIPPDMRSFYHSAKEKIPTLTPEQFMRT